MFLMAAPLANAQKYACFDSEYVLSNIPDYIQAQKRLDQYVVDWQKELEAKQQELDNLRKAYQQEAYILPENLKQRRQEDLKTKEQELKALQHQRFDVGGDLDKKRAELVKPIQDRVYNAITKLAHEKSYAFVLDKAGNSSIVYASDKYDLSNQLLEMLGYTPGEAAKAGNADAGKGSGKEGGSNSKVNQKESKNNRDIPKERAAFKDRGDKDNSRRK